jgi:hypothetical protein
VAERKVDVLVVRWYERADRSPDVVGRWLTAAREHLPEAVPRRFGDYEPLAGRFATAGEQGLAEAYGRADPLLFLAGTPPVFHASWATSGPVAVHGMQAELDPGDDRVRRFALALTHPGMLYVSASISGGETLDRGTLYGPGERPAEPYLAPHGRWLGLPPEAPLWCWFGPGYARLVRRHITAEPVAGGLWFTGGPWVPDQVRARLHEVDPARRHARRVPGSPWRWW